MWMSKRSGTVLERRATRRRCRPRCEILEDRVVLSQIGLTVNSLADSGPGSLRAAILTADAGRASDKFAIGFAVTGVIDLQSPLPDLNNTIAVQGPGQAASRSSGMPPIRSHRQSSPWTPVRPRASSA